MTSALGKVRTLARRAITMARSPTSIYLLASGLSRLGAIVLIPIYARRLTQPEYGDYALAQTLAALIPSVMTLGLVAAVPRAFFGEKDEQNAMRSAADVATWAVLFAAGGGLLLGLVLALWPAASMSGGLFSRYGMATVIAASVGATITSVPSTMLRAAQKPLPAAAFQLCEFFSVAGLGVIFVGVLGRGLQGALEALMAAYVLNGLLGLWFIVFKSGGRLRRGVLRPALRFGLPFVPHFLAHWGHSAADRWTLKFVGLESAVGAYAMAGQVVSPVAMATAAWNDAATAKIGEAFRDDGRRGLKAIFGPMQRRYLLSAALPGAVILASLPLMPIILGSKATDVLWMVPLLLVINLIDTQYYPASSIVYFADRTALIPWVTLGAALLNIAGNVVLVPWFGLAGALLARLLSITARALVLWIIARVIVRPTPGGETAAEAS